MPREPKLEKPPGKFEQIRDPAECGEGWEIVGDKLRRVGRRRQNEVSPGTHFDPFDPSKDVE
jgi:hypothetical protein